MSKLFSLRAIATLVLAAVIFTSCGSKSSGGGSAVSLIPQNAAMVMTVDAKSIFGKFPIKEIQQMVPGGSSMGDAEEQINATGISLYDKAYLFLDKIPADGEQPSGALAFSVSDAAKLKAFLADNMKMEAKDVDGVSVVNLPGAVLAWKGSAGVVMPDGSESGAVALFSNKNSILDNASFKSTQAGSFDLGMWLSGAELGKTIKANMDKQAGQMPFEMPDFSNMMKSMAMTLSFENGKVAIKASQEFTEEGQKMIGAINAPSADELGLYSKLMSANTVGFMTFSMPAGYVDMLMDALNKSPQASQMTEGLKAMGLSMDDVKVPFTSPLFATVSSDIVKGEYDNVVPKFSAVVKVNAGLKTLLENPMLKPMDGYKEFLADGISLMFRLEGDYLIVTTDAEIAKGNMPNAAPAKAAELLKNQTAAYVDVKNLAAMIANVEPSQAMMVGQLGAMFESAETFANFNGANGTSEFSVNLKDKNTNALKQIATLVMQAGAMFM